jgi:hypothetical protein
LAPRGNPRQQKELVGPQQRSIINNLNNDNNNHDEENHDNDNNEENNDNNSRRKSSELLDDTRIGDPYNSDSEKEPVRTTSKFRSCHTRF